MKEKEQQGLISVPPPFPCRKGGTCASVYMFWKENLLSAQQSLWAFSVLQQHQALNNSMSSLIHVDD